MGKKAVWSVVAGGVAAVAVAATIAVAAPAAAQTGGQGFASGESTVDTAERPAYCDRVDTALAKRQQVVARLEGDAGTRGSIAWLNERAAAATAGGNTELATLFTDRVALRGQVVEPLKTLITDLAAVQQAHCS